MPKVSIYTANLDLSLVVTEENKTGRTITATHVQVQAPTIEGLKRKVIHLLQVLDDDDFTAGPQ